MFTPWAYSDTCSGAQQIDLPPLLHTPPWMASTGRGQLFHRCAEGGCSIVNRPCKFLVTTTVKKGASGNFIHTYPALLLTLHSTDTLAPAAAC